MLRKSGFIPMLEELYKQQNNSLITNNKQPSDRSFAEKAESSKMTFTDNSLEGLKININLELPTNARLFLAQNSESNLYE